MRSSLWIAASLILAASIGAGATAAGERQESAVAAVPQPTAGAEQFRMYCATCHGAGARGDGPLAQSLKRKPPDLTMFASRNGGIFAADVVAQIIDGRQPVKGHGGEDMPVWGDAFRRSGDNTNDEQVRARIDAIVKWLSLIQRSIS